MFASHLGRSDDLSERKVAELYEQVGRLMVDAIFYCASFATVERARRLVKVEREGPLSLRRQCQLLGLNRCAVYHEPVEISAYELELMCENHDLI
ncbi:MAG TPA: hypothetical protein VKB84_03185 [Candidatus Binataceae bacterium]|nr:hypothetical protein [Candidatus Binataceae bacterium]